MDLTLHLERDGAFITAQIFLRLLKLGRRFGRDTLGALAESFPVEEASVSR